MLRRDCMLDNSTVDKDKCIHYGEIKKCPAGCQHYVWHINAEPTETEEFYDDEDNEDD